MTMKTSTSSFYSIEHCIIYSSEACQCFYSSRNSCAIFTKSCIGLNDKFRIYDPLIFQNHFSRDANNYLLFSLLVQLYILRMIYPSSHSKKFQTVRQRLQALKSFGNAIVTIFITAVVQNHALQGPGKVCVDIKTSCCNAASILGEYNYLMSHYPRKFGLLLVFRALFLVSERIVSSNLASLSNFQVIFEVSSRNTVFV